MRKLTDDQYAATKNDMADRLLHKRLLHQPRGQELDQEKLKSQVLSILDQARQLEEVNFELQKDALAQELKEAMKSKPQEKKVDLDRRIERFLLSPEAIEVLEEKLAEDKS